MKRGRKSLSRREFIAQNLHGAGLCVLGLDALSFSARAAQPDRAASPFAYDIERFSTTDPRLIKYEQVKTFSGLHPEPRRIAVGPDHNLYFATRPGVDKLDRLGNKLAEIETSSPVRCLAVAGDGKVYAGMRSHIEVFDPNGRPLGVWEPPTKKTWFTGLSAGANDLFAADSANRVVLRYDLSGKLIGRIGEKNPERNVPSLIVPSPYLDVKLGADGLLRVNNPGRHCVEVFTPNGDLEFSWGKPSGAIEGFCGCCNPIGLAVLPDGRCITCEKGLPRVKVYAADHSLDGVVAGPELFRQNSRSGQLSDRADGTLGGLDAAVDADGQVFILDLVTAEVRVMKLKS